MLRGFGEECREGQAPCGGAFAQHLRHVQLNVSAAPAIDLLNEIRRRAGHEKEHRLAAARIERLVRPLRDAFAALFFFAFGLSIDPGEISTVLAPAAAAIVLTLVLTMTAAIAAARINHLDRQAALNIAFSVAARGEFALILVTLAADAGLDTRLAPFVAVHVLVLALVSPILAHRSAAFVRFIPARLLPAAA